MLLSTNVTLNATPHVPYMLQLQFSSLPHHRSFIPTHTFRLARPISNTNPVPFLPCKVGHKSAMDIPRRQVIILTSSIVNNSFLPIVEAAVSARGTSTNPK
jgi:hypothetical protein